MTLKPCNTDVDMAQLVDTIKDKIMADLNCHNVGRIVAFDKTKQTATIEIMALKGYNDFIYNLPLLVDVPLIMYGTTYSHITLPDPTGCYALLFFLDRNIDNFIETGEAYMPASGRMHDFSDCIAITTFQNDINPIEDYDDLAISILHEAIISDIQYRAHIKNYGNYIEQYCTSIQKNEDEEEVVASSTLTQTVNDITLKTSAGSKIVVADKLNLQNTSQNLAALMQSLLTACEGIVTINGGALTPSSQQAFTNLKTQFGDLLR